MSFSVSAQPWSYASFIISPGKRWPDATILVEDQDAFEFPDKKIRVRVKGCVRVCGVNSFRASDALLDTLFAALTITWRERRRSRYFLTMKPMTI